MPESIFRFQVFAGAGAGGGAGAGWAQPASAGTTNAKAKQILTTMVIISLLFIIPSQ
jgi:hypothetical protein